jgi:hypothetical protein
MVELDTNTRNDRQQGLQCVKIIVASPICIGYVIARRAPPWLSGVDSGGNAGRPRLRHDEGKAAAETTIKEIRIVVDAVIRREDRRVEL